MMTQTETNQLMMGNRKGRETQGRGRPYKGRETQGTRPYKGRETEGRGRQTVTYTEWTSSEMCSLHLTHPSAHTHGAVAADAAVPEVPWCLAQGSHLSRGQFLPEPRFEPTTSGYKSDALSIRPRLPLFRLSCDFCCNSWILSIEWD